MSEVKLGRVVPIYKGEYNETTQYHELDIVYYNGSSYMAKQDTKGNTLPTGTENDYWGLVVDKGPQGPKGDTGDTGAQGKQGSMGPEGPQGETGKKGDRGTSYDYHELLKYKMISNTVADYLDGHKIPDSFFTRCSEIGATVSLVVMVPVENNGVNKLPYDYPIDTAEKYIKRALDLGTRVDVLKPHIGYTDVFDRFNYNPTDYVGFFNNWKSYLVKLAKLCDKYNIKFLSIGCEQYKQSGIEYLEYWKDIINAIKEVSQVSVTYAFSKTEFQDKNHRVIMPYLDVIGVNIYPRLTDRKYSDSLPILTDGWKFDPLSNFSFEDVLYELSSEYNKDVLVTEVGASPYIHAINESYAGRNPLPEETRYDALALYIKSIYYNVSVNGRIIGIAWWHGEESGPFSFFKYSTDEITMSEQAMRDAIKEY